MPTTLLSQQPTEEWLSIPLDVLRVDSMVEFPLYIRTEGQADPVLYRGRSLAFTRDAQSRLHETGISELYVSREDEFTYRRYVELHLSIFLADPSLPLERKATVVYESARELIRDVMADPRAGDIVPRSKLLVENVCSFMHQNRGAFSHLLKVVSFDYYTYTHSVNVFVFTVSLARQMKYSDEAISDIGTGALLHDIGKSQIDPAIVNCPGRLSPEQWKEMRMHPVYGYDLLVERGGVSAVGLDVVRHHHEKLTGKGYPDGLTARELSQEARISAIADVFDALTTRRSYKEALGSFPALQMMRAQMADELDQDLFSTFVRMMGRPG